MTTRLLTLIVLVAVMSGCSAADPLGTPLSAPTTSEPPPSEGGSRVEGTVTDVEQRPIENVKISLQAAGATDNRTVRSAVDGRFAFRGVEPGRYHLAAESVFYQTGHKTVDVVAEEPATASFQLLDVIKDVAYVDVYPIKGFINCSVHSLAGYGPFNLCSAVDGDESRFDIPIEPDSRTQGVVLEVMWTPATPATGTDFELALCDKKDPVQNPVACRATVGSAFRRDVRGKSPLVLHENELPLADYDAFEVTVSDGGQTSARVPLTFQQPFELWISVCHVVACPEAYQARST